MNDNLMPSQRSSVPAYLAKGEYNAVPRALEFLAASLHRWGWHINKGFLENYLHDDHIRLRKLMLDTVEKNPDVAEKIRFIDEKFTGDKRLRSFNDVVKILKDGALDLAHTVRDENRSGEIQPRRIIITTPSLGCDMDRPEDLVLSPVRQQGKDGHEVTILSSVVIESHWKEAQRKSGEVRMVQTTEIKSEVDVENRTFRLRIKPIQSHLISSL